MKHARMGEKSEETPPGGGEGVESDAIMDRTLRKHVIGRFGSRGT